MNKPKEESGEEKKPQRVLSAEPSANKGNSADTTQSMSKSMNIMMPLMTLWITFTVPAALGLYWTISNIVTIIQQLVLNKIYGPKYKEEVDAREQEKALLKKEKAKLKKKKK